MRSSYDNQFIEVLSLIKPETLIATLEDGIEIGKLKLLANPHSEEIKNSIHYSNVLLAFLRLHRLGRRD